MRYIFEKVGQEETDSDCVIGCDRVHCIDCGDLCDYAGACRKEVA